MVSCSDSPGDLASPIVIAPGVTLSVTEDNIPADDYSYVELSAAVSNLTASTGLLTFVTDRGIFANGKTTYSVPVNGTAETKLAYLRYNRAEKVHVTAFLGEKVAKETFATFITAYPTQVLLSTDSGSVVASYNSVIQIKAQLNRQVGKVSEGMLVSYYDSTENGRSVGSFTKNEVSDAQGKSSANYSIQDTSYHGYLYLKGYIQNDVNKVLGVVRVHIR